jgi:hypothetical protein
MEALMVQFSQASGEFAEFSFGCIGHSNPFPGIDPQSIVRNCDEAPSQTENPPILSIAKRFLLIDDNVA